MSERWYRVTNPKTAILIMTLYGFCSGAFSTYFVSMISTIEKRFEWPNTKLGWLLAADDIGYLTCVLPIAYFGGKGRHRVVLCCSALMLFAASLLRVAPFFIFGPKFLKQHMQELADEVTSSSSSSSSNSSRSSNSSVGQSTTYRFIPDFEIQQMWAFIIELSGGVLQGIANTPFWNVGAALIDDMSGRNSGAFLGFLFLIRTLSPIFGFVLGGQLTTVNEGLQMTADDFVQGIKDPMWIGAWWLGILAIGIVLLLNTPLLALLDVKKLQAAGERDRAKHKAKGDAAVDGDSAAAAVAAAAAAPSDLMGSVTSLNVKHESGAEAKLNLKELSFRDLIFHLKELYTNTVFLTMYLGSICEFAAFMMFFGYFPKFIESHFHVSAKSANLMSSGSLAGASALAMIISGLLTKVYPMSLTHMNLYHAIVNSISALMFPLLFLFKCGQVDMVAPHNHQEFVNEFNLTNCIQSEKCQQYHYEPICIDSKSFMSGCYAGCTKVIADNVTAYTNCLCSNLSAVAGVCEPECSSVYYYLILFFVIRVIGTIAAVHFTLVILRLPKSREFKPLAMGSISFVFGIMGVITPPIAGKLIDTACIVQNPSQTGRSFCLFYDTDKFRYLMHGIATVFQIPSCLLFFLSYWLSRSRYPVAEDEVTVARRKRRQKRQDFSDEMQRLPAES